MKSWERWVVYPMCIIAILFALCAASWNISADKSGFIVGVLAVLVTTIVGWQIYNAIGMQQIVKNYDSLQRDFERSNEALKAQDLRNVVLIEAFAKYYEAKKEKDSKATQYRIYLEAYLLFLRSNIPLGNEYIGWVRGGIIDALTEMEKKTHPLDKKLMIDHQSRLEDTYEAIREELKIRKNEISEFISELKNIRDRRRDLIKKFEKEKQ